MKRWRHGAGGDKSFNVMDRQQNFERSNAFVDGELDRKARGEVLEDSARDPRLAQELSNLNRLKSAIEDSVDVPDIELPAPTSRPWIGSRAVWAIAACLALVAVAGIGWMVVPFAPSHGVPVAWAIETHSSWEPAGVKPNGRAMLRPANAQLNAHVPDLSAAKLYFAHISDSKNPAGLPALVVGYRGTRGCRVTLLIDSSPEKLGEKAINFEIDGLRAVVWKAGPLRHVILAEGMAPQRFKMIAETVRRTSLERLPIDNPTRTALARSRATSPPCAA